MINVQQLSITGMGNWTVHNNVDHETKFLTHPASGVVLKLQRYNPLKTGALFQCWRDKVGE